MDFYWGIDILRYKAVKKSSAAIWRVRKQTWAFNLILIEIPLLPKYSDLICETNSPFEKSDLKMIIKNLKLIKYYYLLWKIYILKNNFIKKWWKEKLIYVEVLNRKMLNYSTTD